MGRPGRITSGGRVLGRGTVALMSALPTGLHELGMGLPPADRKAIEQRLQRLRRDGLVEVLWRHPSRGQAPNVYDLTPYGRERLEYAQAVYAQETAA